MSDILQRIVAVKREEIAAAKRRCDAASMRREALAQPPARDFVGGAAREDRRRAGRGDRRDQEGQPEQGRDARALRAGRDRGVLRAAWRGLPERAHRPAFFQGDAAYPAAGARRLQPAGAAQGLHGRCLPGGRSARLGRGLHPADRRLPGRRADGRPGGPGAGTGHGGAGRGARCRRTRACAAPEDAAAGHQQPQPARPSRSRSTPRSACCRRCRPSGCWSPKAASSAAPTCSACARRGVHAFLVGEAFMRQPDPGVALAALFG